MKRYYPRFDGKEGLEERYVVVDATTREPASGRLLYHEANNQAHARNEGTYAPPLYDASLVALPVIASAETLEQFAKAWLDAPSQLSSVTFYGDYPPLKVTLK